MAEIDKPSGVSTERTPRLRRPRWGVRTLWSLAVAFVAVLASTGFVDAGKPDLATVATVVGWVAFIAAAYCSYRGLRAASWLPR
jgi:hypothetical protein